jgi:hypothetical protein
LYSDASTRCRHQRRKWNRDFSTSRGATRGDPTPSLRARGTGRSNVGFWHSGDRQPVSRRVRLWRCCGSEWAWCRTAAHDPSETCGTRRAIKRLWHRRLWCAMIGPIRGFSAPLALRTANLIGKRAMKHVTMAATVLAAMAVSANAQVARLEVYPVSSVTLKDSDFLGDRISGQPVTIKTGQRQAASRRPPPWFRRHRRRRKHD